MKTILIPLADGVEEMEAVILIDVLRRAGWSVVSAGLHAGPVTASRGVRLIPDCVWDDVDVSQFDWMVLPGGLGGTETLMADPRVIDALKQHVAGDRRFGAICAAPLVLQAAGLLADRVYTSHPAVSDRLTEGQRQDKRVVVDGNLITSQGPGTAFEFALALVECEDGPEKARSLADAMCLQRGDGCPNH